MKKSILLFTSLLSIFILYSDILFAQAVRSCGTMEYLQLQEQQKPGAVQRWIDAQNAADEWVKNHPSDSRNTITIPVVVHVVYHTSAQNISDNQINSQIEVLNEDFQRRNADTSKTPEVWKPVAGSMDVEFCLANYDPSGDATSGIIRTETDVVTFNLGDSMKYTNKGGDDAWPCTHYLNIWVCNLGNGTLGYTTLPTQNNCNSSDGVVVQYNAFGRVGTLKAPYNKGRTATHEVGHWLGLSHCSGDDGNSCTGDDGCSDTPKEADNIFNCPVYPYIDQCSGAPDGVMFMNYMDYTDDACMNLFTLCQCSKMLGILNSSRQSLFTSPGGCQGVAFNLDASLSTITFPVDTLPSQGFAPQVQLKNSGIDDLTYVEINYQVDGQNPVVLEYQGLLASTSSTLVTLPPYFTGEFGHISTAWTSNPNHGIDQFIYNDTATAPFFVRSTVLKNTTTISVVAQEATDQWHITVQNPSDAIIHLQVVNVMGQIIQEGNWSVINNPSFMIDLSGVASGTYFLFGKIGFDYVREKIMVVRK